MKKILFPFLTAISVLICFFIVFTVNDEYFSKREMMITGIAVLIAVGSGICISRIAVTNSTKYNFLYAGIIALFLCFSIDKYQPINLYAPEKHLINIKSTQGSEVSLTWAYWAQSTTGNENGPAQWEPWKDLSFESFVYQGDWTRAENRMQCRGDCSIVLPAEIHMHRMVFCFESDSPARVQDNEKDYEVIPDQLLRIFVSGRALRPLCLLTLWLSLTVILGCLFVLIHSLTDRLKITAVPVWIIYLLSFLIPTLILLLICYLLKICPFGEKTFLLSDMQAQYVDFLVHFREQLRSGGNIFYSFSKSLGDDYLSLFAYYLSNPLDWLIALFPDKRIPEGISLIVLLRFSLCGLTAAVYFRKIYKAGLRTLIFSTSYALMSMNFTYIEHTQLRNGVIILPLVFLGIDYLIENKSRLLYVISLGAAMFLNYYSAFQICYFAVPYFIFRLVLSKQKNKKAAIVQFGLCSLLSAGLCAAFLIPVAMQLRGGMKTFDLSVFTLDLNMNLSDLLGKLFSCAYDKDQMLTSGFPNLFCGILAVFSIPLFFLNQKIGRKKKFAAAGLLMFSAATMLINALNLIAHGFNEPVWWPYRYSFIVSFFLLIPAAECFFRKDGNKSWHFILSAGLLIVFLLYLERQTYSWLTSEAVMINISFCIAVGALLFVSKQLQIKKAPFLLFVCFDLFINGWMILGEKTSYLRSETAADFVSFYVLNKDLMDQIHEYDQDLYRVEKNYSRDANDSFLLGYNGVSHFSSTLKYATMRFLPAVGYRFYPTRFLYGEGSTVTMDSLLGIRYLAAAGNYLNKPYEPVFTQNDKTVFLNPCSFPIGFLASNVNETDTDIYTVPAGFEPQNVMIDALSGTSMEVFTPADILQHNVQDNEILWTLEMKKDGALYAFFDAEEEVPVTLSVNENNVRKYFDGFGHPIIKLGDFSAGTSVTVMMSAEDREQAIALTDAQFYQEDMNSLKKAADRFQNDPLNVEYYDNAHIQGYIQAEKDSGLFFSIPYDAGWTLYIDDIKTKISPAFDTFMTAGISRGIHNIRLEYKPQGLNIGIIVSMISLVSAAAIFFMNRHKKAKHVTVQNETPGQLF